jgi:uncharacterized protein
MAGTRLPEHHCHRCIYAWIPRRTPVRRCPRCHSTLWDQPREFPIRLGRGLGIPELLGPHRDRILAIAKNYGARRVRAFGSVRRREATRRSDIDLLVPPLPNASLLDHARLQAELRELVGRRVDVVEEDCLFWPVRPRVLAEAVDL